MPQNDLFFASGSILEEEFQEWSFFSVLNYRYDLISLNKTFIPDIGRPEDYFTSGDSLNAIFLATSISLQSQAAQVKLLSLFPL